MHRICSWLLPASCLGCRRDRRRFEAALCRRCQRSAARQGAVVGLGPDLDAVVAGRRFEAAVRDAVLRFKYNRRFYLARLFGRWLGRRDPFDLPAPLALVPVPMAYVRRCRRGYNPAEILARELGRRWGIPVRKGWLARRWLSVSQTRLDRAAREKNAAAVYRLIARRIGAVSVILVDDVITTGATLRVCARLLRRAGVQRVCAVAAAYDPRKTETGDAPD